MLIKTLICDDNEKARYILKEYLKIISVREIEVVGETQNGYDLIDLCKKEHPDLILLDIDMPFMNGIETAKRIIEFLNDVSFIFITAYSSFSLESFEVHPADFILKPISIDRLEKSLNYITQKISKYKPQKESDYITVSWGHESFPLRKSEILFAERVQRKTIIHTVEKELEVYEALDNLHEKLDHTLFFRSHNSYLININAVSKVDRRVGGSHKISFKNYNNCAYISRRNLISLNNILKNVIK